MNKFYELHHIPQDLILLEEVNITVVPEKFESNGATIVLNWTTVSFLHAYHVSVTPQVELMFNSSTRVHLRVQYDTKYNVTVEVIHPCGLSNLTVFTQLYYSKFSLLPISQYRNFLTSCPLKSEKRKA